ncbi:hypothetical protein [Nocardioides sp. SYSU D00038]|uniref:hypothetical protein n=1 Tax=Nocardioides sp. SYSU D00038 TaxID=2812554 RepID=UPI001966F6EF|nr:hypothetical protein [Nocardioides sp. SYSU D00038]
MNRLTDKTRARVDESREALTRLIEMQATEGRIDPREASLLLDAIGRLDQALATHAHAVAADR